MSDTPKTDAVLSLMPNDGFGLQKSQCIAQMADHSRILERENAALREKLAAEDAMGRENKAGSTSTDAEILASDLKSRSLPNNPAPIATVLDKISRFCADKEGNLLLHETGYLVLWDDYAALREKLAAAEKELEGLRQTLRVNIPSSEFQAMCNCGSHRRGELTGGWYCPIHGQQL